jgi:uncharacterized repeat protein (TIGR03803 family)
LSTTGQETVLHSFAGGADGGEPHGGVIQDAKGNLYGTTYYGGAAKHGVVFKLSKTGKETVLYNFKGGSDGSNPAAGLIQDSMGNLYGTTSYGGTADHGVVFKLSKTGKETALYSFCSQSGCADGDRPSAVVTLDSKGNFYGTTEYGGAGYGVVFKLGKTGKETVLHTFTNDQGKNVDGAYPLAGVIQDSEGNLYGTTSSGGTYVYSGTIFKLNKAGKETVLYSLTGGGSGPLAGVIRDSKGNLYGTTYTTGFDGGAVFELKP